MGGKRKGHGPPKLSGCGNMNKAKPGDIIVDAALGPGLVIYYEVEARPICAFPQNPELVVCDDASIEGIGNISQVGESI